MYTILSFKTSVSIYFEILSFVAAAEFQIESLVLKSFLLFGVWLQKGVWLDVFEVHFVTITIDLVQR